MGRELQTALTEGLKAIGVHMPDEAPGLFMRYLEELKKWNRAYSITSIRDDRDVVISHFLDSAIYIKGLFAGTRSLADIGSGGGFPGMPIKILCPEMDVHLVEPNRKKATFLRMLAGRLDLKGVTVHEARLEEITGPRVDAAVTRALFSAGEFYGKARGILNEGGRLVLSKGPRYAGELEDAAYEYDVIDVPLPFSDATRHIIVIRT